MGSIPLPALDIKPAEDPLTQYAKALSVSNMIQGQKTTALQQTALGQENQQRQIALQDQQAMTAAMHEWDGKSYDDLIPLVVKHGASSTAVIGLKGKVLEQQQTLSKIAENDANTKSKNLETLKGNNDLLLGHIDAVIGTDEKGNPNVSDEDLVNRINLEKNTALHGGYLDKAHADAIDKITATNNPDQIRAAMKIFEKTLMGQKEQFEQAKTQAEIDQKNWKELSSTGQFYNIKTGELRTPAGLKMTAAQAEAQYIQNASDQASGKPLTDAQKAFQKGFEQYKKIVPQFQFNLAGGATGGLDQNAIDMQAEKYWQTGALPPVGRGAAGLGLVHTIMQRASDLHKGESLAANSAAFKANQVSLDSLQKNFDQVSAFENTANKNLDLYLSKLKAVPDLGVRFANVPLRSLTASMIGAGNLAAVNAARQTAATETAKVLASANASGVLSDSQKKEAMDVLDGNLSYNASVDVVNTLKQDFGNRHESYQNQIADIKKRMGAGETKPAGTSSGGGAKVLTMAQIKQAAKDNNVSVEEATRQATAAGYEVKQQ